MRSLPSVREPGWSAPSSCVDGRPCGSSSAPGSATPDGPGRSSCDRRCTTWHRRRRGTLPGWVRKDVAARAGLADLLHERPEPVTGIAAVDERLDNLTGGYVAEILELGAIVADLTGHRSTHPFLDPRFILATYGLDPWWPTRDGATRALQAAAFVDRIPPLVAERRSKAQFAEVFWPTLLHDDVVDAVRRGPLNDLGWLDDQGFDDLVGRARRGMANAAIPLARCVSVDHWLRSL